ncbi:hypothetical protein J6590_068370 [Homalodisca vitripennis]|nr:hypothetical protein J6590_068370 [Homalodisca vitripennis]
MDTTEHTFDSEDLAVFYKSLQLLHSPKIDSQRKLFRKHHPNIKSGVKKKFLDDSSSEYNVPNKADDSQVEAPATTIVSQRDPRLHKGSSIPKPTSFSTRDPRVRVQQSDNKLEPESKPALSVSQSYNNYSTFKLPQANNTTSCTNSFPQNKYRVAHTCNRDQSSFSKQLPLRPISKISSRNNYCPNPVNLKKIRAVLARGDPFPTHLTKACINNITPDLQREKL